MYTELDYNNYLAHHGIKGQKWGQLNGPPYPLDAEDHSAREKKEGKSGWTKSAKKEKNNKNQNKKSKETNTKKGLSDKQKKFLKVAAGITVTAAVAYVGYKLYKDTQLKKEVNNIVEEFGSKKMEKVIKDKASNIAENILDKTLNENGIKKLSESTEELKDTVYWVNKNGRGYTFGRNHNCVSCAFATELRRRGFDVCSKEQTTNYKLTDVMKVFGKPDRFRGEKASELKQELLAQGNGTRGIIMGNYIDAEMGSHFFNYIIDNGKVLFLDGQANSITEFDKMFLDNEKDIWNIGKTMFMRVDNKEPNIESLLNYVEPNDGGHFTFTDELEKKWEYGAKIPISALAKTKDNGKYWAVKRSYGYVKGTKSS